MTTAPAEHTATLLPNGKILITGGEAVGFQALASAKLYDPSTGMFIPTGSMTTVRIWGHTATLLANAKVLIAGGSGSGVTFQPLASAEVYDPSTGMFTPTGGMTSVQRAGPATLLPYSKVCGSMRLKCIRKQITRPFRQRRTYLPEGTTRKYFQLVLTLYCAQLTDRRSTGAQPRSEAKTEKLGSNLGPDSAEQAPKPCYKTQNQAKRFN